MHRQEEPDQRRLGDIVLHEPIAGHVGAAHLHARRLERRRGRGQPERLAPQVVGGNQQSTHEWIILRCSPPETWLPTETVDWTADRDCRLPTADCRLSYALTHVRRRSAARSGLFRPPARTLDALLHRDVGALQLLRHARVPHPVHDRAGQRGRAGLRGCATRRRSTAPTPAASGAPRSSAAGSPTACSASTAACSSAASSSRRPLHAGVQVAAVLLHRPRPDRHRHRPAEAERQHARRLALSRRATRAATPGSRSSTWGSTSARSSGRSSPAIWRSASTGTRLRVGRRRHGCSASMQYVARAKAAAATAMARLQRDPHAGRRRRHDRQRRRRDAGDERERRLSPQPSGSGSARSSSSSWPRCSSGAPTSRPDRR